jgi:FkbM family methyltransferase
METETREHVAFLIAECQRDVYLSGKARVKPGAIVLDVGANVGLFSLQAVQAGARQVVAIEPAPGNLHALRRNLGPEIAAERVVVVAKGAWHMRETLTFAIDPKHPARSSLVEPLRVEGVFSLSIEVSPLDEVARELRLPRVDFIKMDIEGAECRALEGAVGILRRDKPQLAIAVEHTEDWLANARSVREIVQKINPKYRCVPGPYVVTRERRLAPEVLYFH